MNTERGIKWWGIRSVGALLVLSICIVVGEVAILQSRARRQAAAVQSIRRIGGDVTYEWQVDSAGTRLPDATEPRLGGWRAMIGLDFFHDVYEVQFPKDVTDEDMRHIIDVRSVRAINLAYCFDISDKAIMYLTELPNLRSLRLYANDPTERNNFVPTNFDLSKQGQISDKSLDYIGRIGTLEELYLWDDDYSDAGLAHLSNLSRLRYIFLRSTRITEAGVTALQKSLPGTTVEADVTRYVPRTDL